jgi:hypothetical protein
LISGQTSPFVISENFKKNYGSIWIYLWIPYCFSNDFTIYLICGFLLWNANMICDTYLSFFFNKKICIFCFQFKFYWFIHQR